MARRDLPYLPLFVDAFVSDERLAECSAAANGVYIRILCLMHKSEDYGKIHLRSEVSEKIQEREIIRLFADKLTKHLPYPVADIENGLQELVDCRVLYIAGSSLCQGRMIRDGLLSDKRSKSGSKGMDKRYSTKSEQTAEIEFPSSEEQQNQESPQQSTAKRKDDKKKYAEFVRMTEAEYAKLVNEYGEDVAAEFVSILDNYKGSTGKRYKNDYRAILSWVVDRYIKNNGSAKFGTNNRENKSGAARNYDETF